MAPTVFLNGRSRMRINQEEMFAPITCVIKAGDLDEAIAIANDTPYGLAGYIQTGDLDHGRKVASRIRAGQVALNYAPLDFAAPFGGYKQSGNGREWGEHAFHEFMEVKAILGYETA